jgi:tripartite-type tricarboxylate transporter receptor subunit TctC
MTGTPPDIVQRLNQDVVRVLSESTIRSRIVQLGSEPLSGTPQRMAELIRSDTVRYREIAKLIRE